MVDCRYIISPSVDLVAECIAGLKSSPVQYKPYIFLYEHVCKESLFNPQNMKGIQATYKFPGLGFT